MRRVLLFIAAAALAFTALGCGMADMTNPAANELDVIIVGDSIYDLDGYIHDNLQAITGYSYKDYSRSGDTISYINDQYQDAIDDNPNVRTIIMDAGGNDILMDVYWSQACQSSTMTVSSSCRSYINGVLDDVEDLWDEMDADGVEAIIHTGYYYLKRGYLTVLLYGGTRLNGAVKYADEQFAIAAGISPANLFFIDPRSSFSGHSSYIISDGIHPSNAGGSVMANLIHDVMVANGIFQGD
ncbi:MAG: SGNH/GDSL hydrolase family protein [Spirochaetes bacterium]|nr:SGNH/GDSL hydrolase family protein [Spirochaetota bacterium]